MKLASLWSRAFLAERPSISLSLFRVAVAFTVGAHIIPSLLHLDDNYFATAFKTKNYWFFPVAILRLVDASPDWVILSVVGLFYATLAMFTIGFCTRLSGILMTLACYFFYALNTFHIGALSFDFLLVTLVLMCVTGYPGDFLSIDSVLRGNDRAHQRPRPFFLQRLLQLQLACTFWYTVVSKISAGGNWITGNPYYHLMHYPAIGVVRDFPFREWLGQHPSVCYWLGITLLVFEAILPFLWFIRRTRFFGIALGIAFQLMLQITLHVPTTFLFLYPPMMLLFIAPEALVGWIARRREVVAKRPRGILLYDGACGFCLKSIERLRILDLFQWLDLRDFHAENDLRALHPILTADRCQSEMVLVEPDGLLSGGFHAFRTMTVRLPLLMALAPLTHLPGASWLGSRIYEWVARRRFLLHRNSTCGLNQCAAGPSLPSSKI